MRRVLILTGVLGAGTALTFAAAALAATLFPNGPVVTSNGWNSGGWVDKGWVVPQPVPVPVQVDEDGVVGPAVELPADD